MVDEPIAPRRQMADQRRTPEQLSVPESMRLLASVPAGRVVFTARALPAVRPVNHLVDGDNIIIGTDSGTPIISEIRAGTIVAYEADQIDLAGHIGWSVIVVGAAHRVIDPDEADSYRRALRPWIDGTKDQVIVIHTDIVTGYRMVGDGDGDGGADEVPGADGAGSALAADGDRA